ncbi:hypothetical protein TcYC6_0080370 [Trypanosoma cruzi]|nr:hypothetical protein TcYC6_0080370 [Trypanosoma cruzi]
MSRNDVDGSLNDVNPDLLELSKDPVAWREQRRRALQEKVFGHGREGGSSVSSVAPAPANGPPSGATASSAPSVSGEAGRKMEEHETYVLQQIMSHKRRRDDAAKSEAAPAVSASPVGLSMKEKLLQRLKNPH